MPHLQLELKRPIGIKLLELYKDERIMASENLCPEVFKDKLEGFSPEMVTEHFKFKTLIKEL